MNGSKSPIQENAFVFAQPSEQRSFLNCMKHTASIVDLKKSSKRRRVNRNSA